MSKEIDGRGGMRGHKIDAGSRKSFIPFVKVISDESRHDGQRTVMLTFVGLDIRSQIQIEIPGELAVQIVELLTYP